MARYLCIHGHFYQPPRDNPWTEAIEPQPSARPYHDWNARVTAECYAPNAASRILDGDGRIARIVNNYARISFDFGPTLLAWLQAAEPAVYQAVLAGDRESRERFSGHGSALAQAYNHVIMPLANRRDKQTQIAWGRRDFEHRFGRPAAGMWLPETAVDLESLDLMAARGVRFTILEPHQARRVRPLASPAGPSQLGEGRAAGSPQTPQGDVGLAKGRADPGEWRDAGGGGIDSTRAYVVRPSPGRRMAVFFYDGPIARAVAFEGLLESGERFVERLLSGTPHQEGGPDRLVHLATDGETYGHHHRRGEMALSYALDRIEANGWATLTNYGEHLAAHPPEDEVEIVENTSWSCVHGVDRWREDCGCRIGGPADWNQAWRAPLRQALDELRDELVPLYEQAAGELFAAPWQARDDYVEVILDRSAANVGAFLDRHARGPTPEGARRVRALRLLEMQRHAMLMYTSCGWFFDDLGGLEAVQVLRYAGRAAQLADQLFGGGCERGLLRRLARARSNDPRVGTGRDLYEARVLPARVGRRQVAAHYAVRSLYAETENAARLYGHEVERRHGFRRALGRARLAAGSVRVRSLATGAAEDFGYGALHCGDPHLTAGVLPLLVEDAEDGAVSDGGAAAASPETFARAAAALDEAFGSGNLPRVVRLLDECFGQPPFALESLLPDERREVQERILAGPLGELEEQLLEIFRRAAPPMGWLGGPGRDGAPIPAAVRAALDVVVNADLRRLLADLEADPRELERGLEEAANLGVALDAAGLGRVLERSLGELLERLRCHPDEPCLLARAAARAAVARTGLFPVDLRRAQEQCYELREAVFPERRAAAAGGDLAAAAWAGLFSQLAETLAIRIG